MINVRRVLEWLECLVTIMQDVRRSQGQESEEAFRKLRNNEKKCEINRENKVLYCYVF